mmetsp:Transcript_30655/g.50644  ORF Transcript_30655/g.50644 Transcript_30655/m.50644 type:complete len:294 (+) Transcript_30655:159-1040(+)
MQQWERKESPRGTRMTFPFQLFALLTQAEALGLSEVITWLPSGDKFVILKPNEFAQRILPKVFRQTKFSSFKRQLNAYGFQREITSHLELDKLVYYNDNFHRDRPAACGQIIRRRPGDATIRSAAAISSSKPFGDVTQGSSDSGESIPDEKPQPSAADQLQRSARLDSHHQIMMPLRALSVIHPVVQYPHYQQPRYASLQPEEPRAAAAMSTQPQYARTVRPDARNAQIGLASHDLAKVTAVGVNDSVLDELAESVADEGVKCDMNTLGKWDPQVEASLSRTNNDESYHGNIK